MKNCRDLILGKVVYIFFIISRIRDYITVMLRILLQEEFQKLYRWYLIPIEREISWLISEMNDIRL